MSDKYDKLRREAESDCKDYGGTICLERSYVKAILDDLAAATARVEAAERERDEARTLAQQEWDHRMAAATRPDPPGRSGAGEERERLAEVGYNASAAAVRSLLPELARTERSLAEESGDVQEIWRRIGDAYAASRSPAAADVEGAARRIVVALTKGTAESAPVDDEIEIDRRFMALFGQGIPSKVARTQARVEFVARVLSELTERRPAAIVLLKDRQYDVVRIYEDASEAQRHVDHYHPSVAAVWKSPDSQIEWHPAGRPDAAGGGA